MFWQNNNSRSSFLNSRLSFPEFSLLTQGFKVFHECTCLSCHSDPLVFMWCIQLQPLDSRWQVMGNTMPMESEIKRKALIIQSNRFSSLFSRELCFKLVQLWRASVSSGYLRLYKEAYASHPHTLRPWRLKDVGVYQTGHTNLTNDLWLFLVLWLNVSLSSDWTCKVGRRMLFPVISCWQFASGILFLTKGVKNWGRSVQIYLNVENWIFCHVFFIFPPFSFFLHALPCLVPLSPCSWPPVGQPPLKSL